MNVLIFSVAPVFPDAVHGGSQSVLLRLLRGLAARGHNVKVACTWRPDLPKTFALGAGLRVYPRLRFRQPFPDPYRAPLCDLALTMSATASLVRWADVVYSHDSGMFALDEIVRVPLVVGVRDISYSETLRGILEFRRDLMIVNSPFAATTLRAIMEPLKPGFSDRLRLVRNAVGDDFVATASKKPHDPIVVLWPHRTDAGKGLYFAVRAFFLFQQRVHPRPAELWVTTWDDSLRVCSDRDHLQQALALAQQLNIQKSICLLPWQPPSAMRALYQRAHVVLCTSTYPEPFSNVRLEGIVSGRFVVAPRSPCFADPLLDRFTLYAEYGDDAAFADQLHWAVDQLISQEQAQRIADRHSVDSMLDCFEAVLSEATPLPALSFQHPRRPRYVQLAPWVYIAGTRLISVLDCGAQIACAQPEICAGRILRETAERIVNTEPLERWFVPCVAGSSLRKEQSSEALDQRNSLPSTVVRQTQSSA